jgi:hypothetical protein
MPEERNEAGDIHDTRREIELGDGSWPTLGAAVPVLPETAKVPYPPGTSLQPSPDSAHGEPEKCSVRNIFGSNPSALEFEEGPPRRRDLSIEAFEQNVSKAQRLEIEIANAETQIEQYYEPLRAEQLLRAFLAYKLVVAGAVPPDVVERVLLESGVKSHGNEKIPCSRFMRAIVMENEAKGTLRAKRKRKRAATYASAVDYGIRMGMAEREFVERLRQSHISGQHHGIEYLAELGRKLRRGEAAGSIEPPPDMPFRIEGNLSGVPPGDHLMLVRVHGETANGALLTVPEKTVRRVLTTDPKSRR